MLVYLGRKCTNWAIYSMHFYALLVLVYFFVVFCILFPAFYHATLVIVIVVMTQTNQIAITSSINFLSLSRLFFFLCRFLCLFYHFTLFNFLRFFSLMVWSAARVKLFQYSIDSTLTNSNCNAIWFCFPFFRLYQLETFYQSIAVSHVQTIHL